MDKLLPMILNSFSSNLIVISMFIVLMLSVYYIVDLYICEERKFKHIPGPPRTSYIQGHVPDLRKAMESNNLTIQDFLYRWSGCHGMTFKLFIFWKCFIVTGDPHGVKEALLGGHPKASVLYKGLVNLYGVRFLGHGLVTLADNATWDHRRKAMDPAFRRQFLKGQMEQFNHSASILTNKLTQYADGETIVSMVEEFHRLTLDLIGKVAFSMDINSVHDDTNLFPQSIKTILHAMYVQLFKPDFGLNPFKRKFYQEAREAVLFLRKVGDDLITSRRNAMMAGEQVPEDILTHSIRVSDRDPKFTKESMIDDFITFFIAGHETTANTLSFTLMELGRRPDVLSRVMEEVDRVIGKDTNMTYDHVRNFTYMNLVIKESMRLYPTAASTFRKLNRTCEIGSFELPQNTIVMVSDFLASRNPDIFENSLDFTPERFDVKGSHAKIPIYSCFPFSLGPRSCIGQTFAQIQTKVILAKFLQEFDFKLTGNQSIDMREVATLKPKSKVNVTLKRRPK